MNKNNEVIELDDSDNEEELPTVNNNNNNNSVDMFEDYDLNKEYPDEPKSKITNIVSKEKLDFNENDGYEKNNTPKDIKKSNNNNNNNNNNNGNNNISTSPPIQTIIRQQKNKEEILINDNDNGKYDDDNGDDNDYNQDEIKKGKESKSNIMEIDETPNKNKRKNEKINSDEVEKKKTRKQKNSSINDGQTKISNYFVKNDDNDDSLMLNDDSYIYSEDEKELETEFKIDNKSKPSNKSTKNHPSKTSKKPTVPNKKEQQQQQQQQTITKKKKIPNKLQHSNDIFDLSQGDDIDENDFLHDLTDSSGSFASSSSSLNSSSNQSKSTTRKRGVGKKKTKKEEEETLRDSTFIIFDKRFLYIEGHNYYTEELSAQDIGNIDYNLNDECIPYSIIFTRRYEPEDENEEQPPQETEKFTIIFLPNDYFAKLILNNEIINYMANIKNKNKNQNFTLLIEGIEKYIKNKSKEQKDKIKSSVMHQSTIDTKCILNQNMVNKTFIQLQLEFGFTIRAIEQKEDVLNFLVKFYSNILFKPLNKKDNSNLFEGFCAESIKKKTKDSNLTEIWTNQLCQINGISLNIARSIVNRYPTIASLYDRFNSFSTTKEKESSLKDIKIDTSTGTRNLGVALSTRIYKIFSSTDPNKIINN